MASRKKTGGRKPNTPNKKTVEAQQLALKLGVNPLEILFHFAAGNWKELGYDSPELTKASATGGLYNEDRISADLRQKSAKDACEYIYAKRKAIDVQSGGNTLAAPVLIFNGNPPANTD